MTQYSYPWTAVGGDRTRTADTAADIYGSTIPTGVIDGLVATANGANVDITAGVAMVHGRFYSSTATESIAYTANTKAYIVLRMTAADRAVVLAKLDGNSSAFPTLTQTDAVYEIAVCSVDSTGTLAVVDTRKDSALCGFYAQPGLDSGWKQIVDGSSTVNYRKIGNVVYVHATYSAAVLAGTTYSGPTLPVGFRPTYEVSGSGRGSSALYPASGIIGTDGQVKIRNHHSASVPNIAASFTYAI